MDTGGYAKECVDTRQPFDLVSRKVGVDQLAKLRRSRLATRRPTA
jgi:hypothetical protein